MKVRGNRGSNVITMSQVEWLITYYVCTETHVLLSTTAEKTKEQNAFSERKERNLGLG